MFNRPIRHADGDLVELEGARVRLKVSGRARRISLRLDRARGEVLAIAPSARRLADAAAFAFERRVWIAQRLADLPAPRRFAPGVEIAVFGETCRLGRAPARASLESAVWERGIRMPLRADDEAYARAIVQLLKREARAWFEARCQVHCAALGVEAPALSIVDAQTRWGSCTPAQRGRPAGIRLSWRLALAPVAVADYVAAHECAHLLEANHGPKFWAHTRRLIGDERPHRVWLRVEGSALHGFGP
ncbi:MAG: M48 family metallopeptidase [Caulobacterales bacterium]